MKDHDRAMTFYASQQPAECEVVGGSEIDDSGVQYDEEAQREGRNRQDSLENNNGMERRR